MTILRLIESIRKFYNINKFVYASLLYLTNFFNNQPLFGANIRIVYLIKGIFNDPFYRGSERNNSVIYQSFVNLTTDNTANNISYCRTEFKTSTK